MSLILIAAVARNGTIGSANRMPWHLPEDARHFREQTAGCPVVMGRKTWDSLPERFRPLPGRANIVVTRQPGWQAPGAQVAHRLDDALAVAAQAAGAATAAPAGSAATTPQPPRIFVIGGADLYAAALPQADELLLTEIDADFDGDARFPAWDRTAFVEAERQYLRAAAPNAFDFAFVRYVRRR